MLSGNSMFEAAVPMKGTGPSRRTPSGQAMASRGLPGRECKRRHGAMRAVLAVLIGMFFSTPALAYLDPGSSGLILQAIVGAIAAGLVAIKIYWRRFLSMLTGREKKSADELPEPPENSRQ